MNGKRTTESDIINRTNTIRQRMRKKEAAKNSKIAFAMVVIGSVLLFLIAWVLSK